MKSIMRSIFFIFFLTAFLFLISPQNAQAANCTWTGINGDWDIAANWDCGKIPGAGDNAIINKGASVTLNSSANVASLTLSNYNAYLTGTGDLSAETINWTSGRITGSGTITATQFANFNGTDIIWLNSRFNNIGVSTWNKGANLLMSNSAVINNLAGATFTVQSSGAILFNGGTFNNAGTFTKTSVDTIRTGVAFNNGATGTVNVEAGVLQMNGNDTNNDGAFHVESGAILRLGGTHNFGGNTTCSGAGTIEIAAGVVNVSGAYSFSGTTLIKNGTLNLSTDTASAATAILTLADYNGYLTGPGDLTADTINWSSGRMTGNGSTTATQFANFSGTDIIWLNGRFNNVGVSTWNKSANLLMSNTAVINNLTGASFTVQSSGATIVSGQGTFNNSGILNLTTGKIDVTTFTQEAGGITNLAIRGKVPITGYSQINATDINLTGPLNISFSGGYTPQVGDYFILLSYSNNQTGDYSPVSISPAVGVSWMLEYEGKSLYLRAIEGLRQVFIPLILK